MMLPTALASTDALFAYLEVEASERAFLMRHSRHRYSFIRIPKRRGGHRTLRVPDDRLKYLQRRLLPLLEALYTPRHPVHGFVRDRSAITNASSHQGRPYLLNVDITDFFGSISRRRVHGMLTAIGLDDAVATVVCALCVTADQLPQGAPTSPILGNMVCYRLDRELMSFAKAHQLRYTRYADDVSVSSYAVPLALFEQGLPADGVVDEAALSAQFRNLFTTNGFALNPAKIRFAGRRSRKEVTGLVVNEFTNLKRTFVRNMRASLYKIETMGLAAAQADFKARHHPTAQLENVLRGRLEWMAQIRGRSFDPYRNLARRFNAQFPRAPLPIDPTHQEIVDRAVWLVEYIYDDPKKGVQGAQGTAFFLRGMGLVSAAHTFDLLPMGMHVDLYRPAAPAAKYRARPSARRDKDRDLILLDHDVPAEGFLELAAADAPRLLKDPITAVGFPNFGPGDELSQITGTIINRPTKRGVKLLEVTALLSDGLSGGPILNDRFQVMGVVQRGGSAEPKQYAVDVRELGNL